MLNLKRVKSLMALFNKPESQTRETAMNRIGLPIIGFFAVMLLSGAAQAGQLFPPLASPGGSPTTQPCPTGQVLSWVSKDGTQTSPGDAIACVDPSPGVSVAPTCTNGQVLSGIAGGKAVCVDPSPGVTVASTCTNGQVLSGITSGKATCVDPSPGVTVADCGPNQAMVGIQNGVAQCRNLASTTICSAGQVLTTDSSGDFVCVSNEIATSCTSPQVMSGVDANGNAICTTVTGGGTPVKPSGLTLVQTPNHQSLTVSWTGGSGNGGANGCKLQYSNGGTTSWTDLTGLTYNCDANQSATTVNLPGDGWTTSWSTVYVQLVNSTGTSLGVFPAQATCSPIANSPTPTPGIDEACNGYWGDNIVYSGGTSYSSPSSLIPGNSFSCPPISQACPLGGSFFDVFFVISQIHLVNNSTCAGLSQGEWSSTLENDEAAEVANSSINPGPIPTVIANPNGPSGIVPTQTGAWPMLGWGSVNLTTTACQQTTIGGANMYTQLPAGTTWTSGFCVYQCIAGYN
jgi:hypothetical protein